MFISVTFAETGTKNHIAIDAIEQVVEMDVKKAPSHRRDLELLGCKHPERVRSLVVLKSNDAILPVAEDASWIMLEINNKIIEHARGYSPKA